MHEKCKGKDKILLLLSFIAVVLSAVVSVFQIDIWLAGTQWILVAIIFAIYATYFKGEEQCKK